MATDAVMGVFEHSAADTVVGACDDNHTALKSPARAKQMSWRKILCISVRKCTTKNQRKIKGKNQRKNHLCEKSGTGGRHYRFGFVP